MSKKIFNSTVLSLLIIGAIVGSYVYNSFTNNPAFSTYSVKKGSVTSQIKITGKVQPEESADLSFESGGKITALNFNAGDSVKAGQVLAKANDADVRALYSQALFSIKSAEATLEEDEALLKREKYKLKSLKSGDTSNTNDKKAQEEQIDAQEAVVSSQEASVAVAKAGAQNIKAQLDQTIISAPFSGVISVRNGEVGEVAASGSPVITLITPNDYKIEAFASELDVANIKIGETALVTLDNMDSADPVEATVRAIDPAQTDVNGISNYKVTLKFRNAPSDLKSGIAANVDIIHNQSKNVLVVPKDSIIEEGGQKFIIVMKNNQKEKQEIKTGLYGNDGMVEIASGLQEGNEVLSFQSK